MNPIVSFLKDISTSRDGESFDVVRVGIIVSVAALLFLTGWDVIANKAHFAALEFGGGVAAILFGGGFGIGAKVKDEPHP